jgi:hypothetical protein
MRTSTRMIVAASAVSMLIGCGGSGNHPSVQSAATEIGNALCTRLQGCSPSGFITAFPGGIPQCVNTFVSTATSTGAQQTCTQAQVDACARDISDTIKLVCSQIVTSSPTLPPSCNC